MLRIFKKVGCFTCCKYVTLIIIIIIFIYRKFTRSAQPDIHCKLLFKTFLPKGPHLSVGFIHSLGIANYFM